MYSDYINWDLTRFPVCGKQPRHCAAAMHVSSKSSIHVRKLSEIRRLQMKQQGLLSCVTLGDHFPCMDLQRTVNYWGVCHMKGGQLSPSECFTATAGLNCKVSYRREWATMCSSFLSVWAQSGAETDTLLHQQSSCQLRPIKVAPHASSRSLSPPPEHNNIMPSGQLTHSVFLPLGSVENDILKMISSLHLAFWKLASKSKTFYFIFHFLLYLNFFCRHFPFSPLCLAHLTDLEMLIKIH